MAKRRAGAFSCAACKSQLRLRQPHRTSSLPAHRLRACQPWQSSCCAGFAPSTATNSPPQPETRSHPSQSPGCAECHTECHVQAVPDNVQCAAGYWQSPLRSLVVPRPRPATAVAGLGQCDASRSSNSPGHAPLVRNPAGYRHNPPHTTLLPKPHTNTALGTSAARS
jgi:hypothetical protein